MQELLHNLTRAVESTPIVALAAALAWGVLSILLSPCHLASIPLVIAFIDRQGQVSTRRALLLSLLFGGGILVTIALIGLITAAAGRLLGDIGRWGNYAVALIFIVVGLHLLEVIPMPFGTRGPAAVQRRGALAALALGLAFGVALGPCTFAFIAPMLGIAFKLGTSSLLYGAALLAAYGIGHCGVIVAAGTSTAAVQRYLTWTGQTGATVALRWMCGVFVVLAGVYFIYTAP